MPSCFPDSWALYSVCVPDTLRFSDASIGEPHILTSVLYWQGLRIHSNLLASNKSFNSPQAITSTFSTHWEQYLNHRRDAVYTGAHNGPCSPFLFFGVPPSGFTSATWGKSYSSRVQYGFPPIALKSTNIMCLGGWRNKCWLKINSPMRKIRSMRTMGNWRRGMVFWDTRK